MYITSTKCICPVGNVYGKIKSRENNNITTTKNDISHIESQRIYPELLNAYLGNPYTHSLTDAH